MNITVAVASTTDTVGGNIDNAATTASASKASSEEEEHPWPYLKQMFCCVGIKDSSFKMKCLLCLPRNKEILPFQNSPSNLKKHIVISEITTNCSR